MIPVLRRLHWMPGVEVAAAVTPPDRPRGRGRQPDAPPVKIAAQELDIPVLQPGTLRSKSAQSDLQALAPDVIVVAAYGRLLPTEVLQLPARGCLNLHPSLLPRHRGPSPVATAILEGDGKTGVSLMMLDEGMDTGPVIERSEIALDGTETAGELTTRLFDLGGALLEGKLGPWAAGDMEAKPQDDSLATLTRKLERADGLVDWTLGAETLDRQCRAFTPWPGLYTDWRGSTLKLLEVSALPGYRPGEADTGQVVRVEPGTGLCVVAGGEALAVHRLQLEGKRPVSWDEFLRGYPDFVGSRLGENAKN